jgi:hypothetical protein
MTSETSTFMLDQARLVVCVGTGGVGKTTTSAALACQVGGQDGFCTEFTVPSVGGVLQVDARAVVVGDSLVTTVLVRSPEADAELAALLGDALRLETP